MSNPNKAAFSTSVSSQEERERRSEPRYDVNEYSDILFLTASGISYAARIMDISRSGIRLRSKMLVTADSDITVYMKDMCLEGRICYCKPNDVGTFDIGVLITDLRTWRME